MRSVVNHFADPYLAIKEAYRVLRPKGQVLIGLAITERMAAVQKRVILRISNKLKSEGVSSLNIIAGKLMHFYQSTHDDHNFRLKYQQLHDLISTTGFCVPKDYWQKPPHTYLFYIAGFNCEVQQRMND